MKRQRRQLLKFGFSTSLLSLLPLPTLSDQPVKAIHRKSPSVLQGATDETQTQFSILFDKSVDLQIYVTDESDNKVEATESEIIERKDHPLRITKAYFSELSPRQPYQLIIENSDTEQIIDQRQFQTLDLSSERFDFVLGSCMDEKNHDPKIWQSLVAQNPQVIFFIGDHCYADEGAPSSGANPQHLWKRFCETRTTLEIFFSPRLIPILAVWDDHDFGQNDSNADEYPFVKQSQHNFLSFFAQDDQYCNLMIKGPGISSAYKFKNQLVLLMDDRSFRKPRNSKDLHAHWGKEQFEWMKDLIKNHEGPTWFFNGSQIFPAIFWKESVSGDHTEQFNELLKTLKSVSSKVIFGSGDVHYSEISAIEAEALGYKTFEVTSSSVHSRSFPGVPDIVPNRRRVVGAGARNFNLVRSTARNVGADFEVICLDTEARVLYRRSLRV